MTPEARAYLQGLGPELTPPMMQGTRRFFAGRFQGLHPDTRISRDLRYGPDERHRLDLFNTAATRDAPVLLFVHGGGFVMGDKTAPDGPFYENLGDFAARNGWLGATMTYRLAPAHPWPAGSQDVAAAVRWLLAHAGEHGGNPRRIYLMGQSAGAVHVAGYVADPGLQAAPGGALAGALLISGSYDVAQADPNPFHLAYYGADPAAWPACSTLAGLAAARLPLLFTVSEFDAADFVRQAALLEPAFERAGNRFPGVQHLAGHNHLSPVVAVGSDADSLGPLVREFIEG